MLKILVPALGRINTQNRDGSEIRFEEMAKLWYQKGFETHIVLPPREEKILSKVGIKATYHKLAEKETYEKENILVIFWIYLKRLIKAFLYSPPASIDLIYIPSDFLIDLIPGLWWHKKNPKGKIVVCLFLLAPSLLSKTKKPTFRSILYFMSQHFALILMKKYADLVLVLNNNDKNHLEKLGFDNKVSVVDMGVDIMQYQSIISQKKLYEACFVGRLHSQKGIFDLIKIWEKVIQDNQFASLAVIAGGSNDVKNKFLYEIEKAGLENNIIYFGFKTGSEKVKIIKQSKIFLLPSHYESWAMTAVEGMAAGLPVVAYDLEIFKDIFPKGMINIPQYNFDMFANTVNCLLTDTIFYNQITKEAISQAKCYDWKKVGERELKLINKLFV